MLDSAGIEFGAKPNVDEDEIKAQSNDVVKIASELAAAKVSINGTDWVIGSDSIISVGGRLFDKPRNRDEAAEHLRFFFGKDDESHQRGRPGARG
jgi:septum formation protein